VVVPRKQGFTTRINIVQRVATAIPIPVHPIPYRVLLGESAGLGVVVSHPYLKQAQSRLLGVVVVTQLSDVEA